MTYRALFYAVAAILSPSLAFAHAQLRRSEPPVGSTVHQAPTELRLTFSESVEPRLSTVTVSDAAGAVVDHHDQHTVADDPKQLAVGLGTLPAGTYRVVWHATSVDTHKTEGAFTFTVAP